MMNSLNLLVNKIKKYNKNNKLTILISDLNLSMINAIKKIISFDICNIICIIKNELEIAKHLSNLKNIVILNVNNQKKLIDKFTDQYIALTNYKLSINLIKEKFLDDLNLFAIFMKYNKMTDCLILKESVNKTNFIKALLICFNVKNQCILASSHLFEIDKNIVSFGDCYLNINPSEIDLKIICYLLINWFKKNISEILNIGIIKKTNQLIAKNVNEDLKINNFNSEIMHDEIFNWEDNNKNIILIPNLDYYVNNIKKTIKEYKFNIIGIVLLGLDINLTMWSDDANEYNNAILILLSLQAAITNQK